MTTRISRGRRLTCPYGPMVDPPFLQPISVEPHSNAIKSHSTTLKSREVPLNHHKPPLNKLKSHEVPLNHHKPLKSYLSSIVFPNKSTIFFPGRLCKRPLGRLRPLGWLRPAGSAGEVLRSGRADFNDENIAWYLWKMACLAMMYNHEINMKQYELTKWHYLWNMVKEHDLNMVIWQCTSGISPLKVGV